MIWSSQSQLTRLESSRLDTLNLERGLIVGPKPPATYSKLRQLGHDAAGKIDVGLSKPFPLNHRRVHVAPHPPPQHESIHQSADKSGSGWVFPRPNVVHHREMSAHSVLTSVAAPAPEIIDGRAAITFGAEVARKGFDAQKLDYGREVGLIVKRMLRGQAPTIRSPDGIAGLRCGVVSLLEEVSFVKDDAMPVDAVEGGLAWVVGAPLPLVLRLQGLVGDDDEVEVAQRVGLRPTAAPRAIGFPWDGSEGLANGLVEVIIAELLNSDGPRIPTLHIRNHQIGFCLLRRPVGDDVRQELHLIGIDEAATELGLFHLGHPVQALELSQR